MEIENHCWQIVPYVVPYCSLLLLLRTNLKTFWELGEDMKIPKIQNHLEINFQTIPPKKNSKLTPA
jgi:hypothetical protein